MRHQVRKGFSRSEFLALGAITAMAGALLLPVFGQTLDKAHIRDNKSTLTCMNNLKQLGLALSQYAQDFNETLPCAALTAKAGRNNYPAYGWADVIGPYTKSMAVYQCPSEKHEGQTNDAMKLGFTDYWLNTNVTGVSLGAIHHPDSLITMGDGDGGASNSNARYNLKVIPRSWMSSPYSPARRHDNGGCYAFVDGHVRNLPSAFLRPNRPTLELK